jgi:hypothetical protein
LRSTKRLIYTMGQSAFMITESAPQTQKDVRWFSFGGCVVHFENRLEVFVGGTLIGAFGHKDVAARNLLLVGLAENRRVRKGKLAHAFGLTDEHLRRLRRQVAAGGLEALPCRSRGGSETKVTSALRDRLHRLFEEGHNAHAAHLSLGKRSGVSYRTVCRVRQAWIDERDERVEVAEPRQLELVEDGGAGLEDRAVVIAEEQIARGGESRCGALRRGKTVQHLGGWLLLGMLGRLGMYDAALGQWDDPRDREALRISLDAVALALGLGQRCVEGVRRLETASAGVLLRSGGAPSESWVRRVLKRYVDEAAGARLHLAMTLAYLERARTEAVNPAVFYVDNHMRPYTGKHTVRRGWRMQDKRVKPGATDYYVHDEDGRPVFRVESPQNDPLTRWLSPIARFLRQGLGDGQRILLAFDRAGAFPEQLAGLRDEGFEFVTYERRPYPALAQSAFDEEVEMDGEVIGVHESSLTNLGQGRGRVRRIALRMADGYQVNLLATSREPARRLIEVMLGRWVQENGFKHGTERWGINQLDRRQVEHYAPETIIPNPARRRLDHALMLARHREGYARSDLARRAEDDPRRDRAQRELEAAIADQRELLALRPRVPTHAALEETELAGRLVYHPGEYKAVLDTLRIACANVESELACLLAPNLRKPAEAKKVLANLFAAPGEVRINGRTASISIAPAARKDEREALEALFAAVNRLGVTLPGDPDQRPLQFKSQL